MNRRFLGAALLCAFSITACAQSSQAVPSEVPVIEEPVAEAPAAKESVVEESTAVKYTTETVTEFPQLLPVADGEEIAVITTNFGDIKVRFFPNEAPKAVENFTTLAKDGYYDGIIFHRVIDGFMIQGGDPTGTGMGGESIWGAPFEDEVSPALRNFRGALSMANSGASTNGSQFFIVQNNGLDEELKVEFAEFLNYQDDIIGTLEDGTEVKLSQIFPAGAVEQYLSDGGAPHLDYSHTVFGHVIEGMEVVDKIAAVETTGGNENKPLEDVVIQGITFEQYKQ